MYDHPVLAWLRCASVSVCVHTLTSRVRSHMTFTTTKRTRRELPRFVVPFICIFSYAYVVHGGCVGAFSRLLWLLQDRLVIFHFEHLNHFQHFDHAATPAKRRLGRTALIALPFGCLTDGRLGVRFAPRAMAMLLLVCVQPPFDGLTLTQIPLPSSMYFVRVCAHRVLFSRCTADRAASRSHDGARWSRGGEEGGA